MLHVHWSNSFKIEIHIFCPTNTIFSIISCFAYKSSRYNNHVGLLIYYRSGQRPRSQYIMPLFPDMSHINGNKLFVLQRHILIYMQFSINIRHRHICWTLTNTQTHTHTLTHTLSHTHTHTHTHTLTHSLTHSHKKLGSWTSRRFI
jgi:hypothetical protein